jgi:hypothetical protein
MVFCTAPVTFSGSVRLCASTLAELIPLLVSSWNSFQPQPSKFASSYLQKIEN